MKSFSKHIAESADQDFKDASESVELDELSPATLKSYKKKAIKQYKQSANKKQPGGGDYGSATKAAQDKHQKRFDKRHKGIGSEIKRTSDSDIHLKDPKGRVRKDPKSNSMTGKAAPYKYNAESFNLDEETQTFKSLGDWVMGVLSVKGASITKQGNNLNAQGLGRKGSATFELKKGRGSMVESADLQEFSNWKIQHPTKSKISYTVKARNAGEAIKKGHAAAIKAGDLPQASDNRMFKPKHIQKEEVGQIDELSKKTLGNYAKKADKQADKASNSYSNAAARRGDFAKDTPAMAKNAKKFAKRDAGSALAKSKLSKMDEINSEKLADYANKAVAKKRARDEEDLIKDDIYPSKKKKSGEE